MIFENKDKIVFTGDSVTDAGRKRPVGEGLWEGLGSCGFHTTDITYHASFGLLALFPDLQKKQMLN